MIQYSPSIIRLITAAAAITITQKRPKQSKQPEQHSQQRKKNCTEI